MKTPHDITIHQSCVTVAVKCLRANPTEAEKDEFQAETELLKTIGYHRHIINLVGCTTSHTSQLYLINPYMENGDLKVERVLIITIPIENTINHIHRKLYHH